MCSDKFSSKHALAYYNFGVDFAAFLQ